MGKSGHTCDEGILSDQLLARGRDRRALRDIEKTDRVIAFMSTPLIHDDGTVRSAIRDEDTGQWTLLELSPDSLEIGRRPVTEAEAVQAMAVA